MNGSTLEAVGVERQFPVRAGSGWFAGRSWIRALNGVDLAVRRGESVGLVGESGSGKSTLGRLLLMLDRPTRGEVRFNGRRLEDMDAAGLRVYRRAVQPVFQNPFSSLNPRMRVRRIVGEPLIVGGGLSRRQVEAQVHRALAQVGLASQDAERFPAEFSGGQRQRVAIARALASEPEIMILDEAVSSQDISIRAQILNLLDDLQKELGVGYLFIAHDLATVRYLCDRVAVMYQGRIVESAESEMLYQTPNHPYTRRLLDASLPDDPDLARQALDRLNPEPEAKEHASTW